MHRAAFWIVAILGVSLGAAACTPAAVPDSTTSPPVDPSQIDLAALSVAVQERGNAARQQNGAAPLVWSDSLATLARLHSEDMARRDFFDHSNPDGRDVNARGRQMGLRCVLQVGQTTWRGFSENLFYTTHYASGHTTTYGDGRSVTVYQWKTLPQIAEESIESWMNSPGHRVNLLQGRSQRAGVGAARSADRRIYVTHVFC